MKMQDWVPKVIPGNPRTLNRMHQQFEIALAEEVLRKDPDDIDAIATLGIAYSQIGEHRKALDMDQRLARLQPDNPVTHYNLACSFAMLGDAEPAIDALQTAMTLGYHDLKWLLEDKDLDSLRQRPEFLAIVERLRQARSSES